LNDAEPFHYVMEVNIVFPLIHKQLVCT